MSNRKRVLASLRQGKPFDWKTAGVTTKDQVNPFNLRPDQKKEAPWTMDFVEKTDNGYMIYEHNKFGFAVMCPIRWGQGRPWYPSLEEAVYGAILLEPVDVYRNLRRFK